MAKSEEAFICFDLGSDTLKVSYAHKASSSDEAVFGKIENFDTPINAFPAIAVFNKESTGEGQWLFGDEAYCQSEFSYIVKIKEMLELVNEGKESKNYQYYSGKTKFPLFIFPAPRKRLSDYEKVVSNEFRSFDGKITPRQLVLDFFAFIKRNIEKFLGEYLPSCGLVHYNVVLPNIVNANYRDELDSILSAVFGKCYEPNKKANSAKSVAKYLEYDGQVASGDRFLLFEMGENAVSVVKGKILGNGMCIEGVEGHEEPIELGGYDVDKCVNDNISKAVSDRETLGQDGGDSSTPESMTSGKLFSFMKDIKLSKSILSSKRFSDSYVPISMDNDLVVCQSISKKQLRNWIGITDDLDIVSGSLAEKLIEGYIGKELSKAMNSDVTKIILIGGLASTLNFVEAVNKYIGQKFPTVQIANPYFVSSTRNDSRILPEEAVLYASSVSGALFNCLAWKIDTVFSLSYGTNLQFSLREGQYDSEVISHSDIVYFELFEKNKPVTSGKLEPDGIHYRHKTEKMEDLGIHIWMKADAPIYFFSAQNSPKELLEKCLGFRRGGKPYRSDESFLKKNFYNESGNPSNLNRWVKIGKDVGGRDNECVAMNPWATEVGFTSLLGQKTENGKIVATPGKVRIRDKRTKKRIVFNNYHYFYFSFELVTTEQGKVDIEFSVYKVTDRPGGSPLMNIEGIKVKDIELYTDNSFVMKG
ncbi:MAG: hypothetical protein MJ239_05290 [Bacilli bacterium]|nr:hypothetical protein [Bacilli bacterium]